jgi:hypothetical protein
MKYLRAHIGMIIAVVAIIWPFLAVWLSAHQLIPVYREGFGFCYFGALFGAMYHWCNIVSKSRSVRNILLAVVVPVCSVVIVYNISIHRNQLFAHWKMQDISSAEWQQMASDLTRLARQTENEENNQISSTNLPKRFDRLGPAGECRAEYVKWEDGEIAVRVAYGGRYRAWGLLVAPDDYLNIGPWSKFNRTRVATNAWFYVGHED